MKIEEIKKALESNGIPATYVTTTKNGLLFKGFQLGKGHIRPVVYLEFDETVDSFVNRAKNIYAEEIPNVDLKKLKELDYVKAHCFLAIQKRSSEKLLKKTFLNVEVILRLQLNILAPSDSNVGSIKITNEFVNVLGIAEDELWNAAAKNSLDLLHIQSMEKVFGMLCNDNESYLFVATTVTGIDGAVALLFPSLFQEFCIKHKEPGCIILPSSTQEIIVMRQSAWDGSASHLANMVREVNAAEVAPVLQLEPVVYRYDLKSNMITIAEDEF